MESIKALLNYLDTDVKLDRGALDNYISDIRIDVEDLEEEVKKANGQLRKCEQELRIIRKLANRYFKNESDALQDELPY